MSDRYPGGFIKAVPDEPTEYTAPGIWTLEQAAVYKKAGKWPLTSDPYFNQTTLLLHGDGSGQELCFEDNSSNDFPITVNGDAYGTPFSPYNTSWSNYFDGTGDYLTAVSADTANAMGSGNWTLEAWIYLTTGGGQPFVFDTLPSGSGTATGLRMRLNTSNQLELWHYSAAVLTSSTAVTLNSWTHVALVKNSGTTTAYINGVASGTYSDSGNYICGVNRPMVGSDGFNNGTANSFPGYISNLRLVKGRAVYTSASFTPPTSPLGATSGGEDPPQGTETTLLTCQSNRFIDNSSNGFTITPAGNVAVKSLSPFAETDTETGSGYFDGSGDYLSIANNAAFNLGTNDFCIEGWFYPTSTNATQLVFNKWGTVSDAQSMFQIGRISSVFWSQLRTTGGYINFTTSTWTLNTWNHFAVVRDGSTISAYLNGVRFGTDTSNPTLNTGTETMTIGSKQAQDYFAGHISGCRIVNGSPVYDPTQTTITIPTSPATPDANTELLTCQYRNAVRNVGFIDSSPNKFLITRNGNTTQGTFSPFSSEAGKWSNYFDGNDYLSISDSTAFNMGSGDFTCECWIYTTNAAATSAYITTADTTDFQGFFLGQDGGSFAFLADSGSTPWNVVVTGGTVVANTWTHVAGVRNGNVFTLYINGTSVGTTTQSITLGNSNNKIVVGGRTVNSQYFAGYISNARVVKGTAVYTSGFTPSTSPLTAVSGTSLLTCQSNRFKDNSANNFAITVNGNPSVQPFSPFAPSAAYSASVNGGSGYFDGVSDNLTFPNSAAVDFSGAFCVEFFIYLESIAIDTLQPSIVTFPNQPSQAQIYINSTNGYFAFYSGAANVVATANSSATLNIWHHLVVCRDGSNNTSIFLNGSRAATAVSSTNWTASATGTWRLMSYDGSQGDVKGYLSNCRFVCGDSVYDPTSTTLTVPTSPLTAITDTELLLNFTNAGIFDNTGKNNLETVGNAQVDTSVVKYGQGSMKFDGTGDYLYRAGTSDFFVANSDFTVECWVYLNSNSGTQCFVNYGGVPWYLAIGDITAEKAQFTWANTTPTNYHATGTTSLATGQWYHLAGVKYGSNIYLYVNGVQEAVTAITGTQRSPSTNAFAIGAFAGGTGPMNGYIDDLRITKGVARYTANFTPPGGPFLNK